MSDPIIRILLVDDERELIDYMSKRLTKKGHQVQAVTSGSRALALAQDQTFDVAVLDLKMPEMDGIEVLRQLSDLQPTLKVVMLTGHGSVESALESGRYDAFRFLVKPYEFEKLHETLLEAYAARRAELSALFQEELSEVIANTRSPHAIMEETRRLREKYEQG